MENFKKVHGCLLGVMIGDALGAPVEMMKPEDILAQTDQKGIIGFDHQVRRKQFRSETLQLVTPVDLGAVEKGEDPVASLPPITRLKKEFQTTLIKYGLMKKPEPNLIVTRQVPEVTTHGSTTDDWQLTNAVCQSLIRRGRFDVTDVALSHVEAYETSTSGWGGTTRDGLKELQEYFNSRGHRGRSPVSTPVPLAGKGSGNGVAMKVCPLALMHVLTGPNYENLATEVADLGRLTHSDPRAWAAAFAVACVLIESGKLHEAGLLDGNVDTSKKVLETTLQHLATFERKYGSGGLKRFSSYLKVLLDSSLLFGPINSLREKIGTGCIAIESVVFALALFLRNPLNFETVVLEAVNSGGDTDTIASIAGALCGFNTGVDGIPEVWANYNPTFQTVKKVAQSLMDTFDPVTINNNMGY